MQARITLCEYASLNPDGTVTMVRAGINRARGTKLPITLNATLVVEMKFERSESGPHNYSIGCVDEDGRRVLQPLTGTFEVPSSGGTASRVLIGFAAKFEKQGSYEFFIVIDRNQQDIWPVKIELERSKGAKKRRKKNG